MLQSVGMLRLFSVQIDSTGYQADMNFWVVRNISLRCAAPIYDCKTIATCFEHGFTWHLVFNDWTGWSVLAELGSEEPLILSRGWYVRLFAPSADLDGLWIGGPLRVTMSWMMPCELLKGRCLWVDGTGQKTKNAGEPLDGDQWFGFPYGFNFFVAWRLPANKVKETYCNKPFASELKPSTLSLP